MQCRLCVRDPAATVAGVVIRHLRHLGNDSPSLPLVAPSTLTNLIHSSSKRQIYLLRLYCACLIWLSKSDEARLPYEPAKKVQ